MGGFTRRGNSKSLVLRGPWRIAVSCLGAVMGIVGLAVLLSDPSTGWIVGVPVAIFGFWYAGTSLMSGVVVRVDEVIIQDNSMRRRRLGLDEVVSVGLQESLISVTPVLLKKNGQREVVAPLAAFGSDRAASLARELAMALGVTFASSKA